MNLLIALLKLFSCSFLVGVMDNYITGSGTYIEVMEYLTLPSVKVSPLLHSIPKRAKISPGPTS